MAKFADQDPELKGLCKKSDAPDLASMVMPKFCVEAAIKAVKRNQNFKSTFVRRGSAVRKNFQTFAVIQLKNILDMGQLPVDLSTTETYAYPEPVKAGVPLRFSVDSIVWKRLVQTPTKSYFTANDLRGGDAQTWKGLFWYWRAKTITSANILEWNLPSGPAGYVMDRLTDGKWNPFNRQYRMWGKIERKSSFVSEEEHAVDSGSLAKIAINASVSDPESGGAEFDLFGTSPVRDQLFDAKLNNVTGVMTLIPKRDLGFLGLKNVMPTKTVLVSPLSYFEEKNTTFSARTIEYNEVAFEQTKVREPEIDQVVKLKISNPRSQVTSMIPKGVSSSNNAISMEPAPLH